MPPLEERTEYPYQNIRTKNFPWGDGDKVSLRYSTDIAGQVTNQTAVADHLVSLPFASISRSSDRSPRLGRRYFWSSTNYSQLELQRQLPQQGQDRLSDFS